MKLKSVLRNIVRTPALGALVLPMFFIALLDWSLAANDSSSRGKAYEVWETANSSFRVRVTAYHDAGGSTFFRGLTSVTNLPRLALVIGASLCSSV